MASGKDVISDILKKKGFIYLSLSDEVREEAKARGLELTRENLQLLGNEMRKNEGNSVLAQKALRKVTDPQKHYIINGIRNTAEIQELKMWPSFYLIAVDSPPQLRFQRMMQRNRPSDPKNYYDFMRLDAIDQGKDQGEEGQQTKNCMQIADYHLFNEFSMERLTDKVTFMIQQIMNKDTLSRNSGTVI